MEVIAKTGASRELNKDSTVYPHVPHLGKTEVQYNCASIIPPLCFYLNESWKVGCGDFWFSECQQVKLSVFISQELMQTFFS